jgi:hypothetical protein
MSDGYTTGNEPQPISDGRPPKTKKKTERERERWSTLKGKTQPRHLTWKTHGHSIPFNYKRAIPFNSILQLNSIQFFNSTPFNSSTQLKSIQFNSIQFFNSTQFNSTQFNSIQFNPPESETSKASSVSHGTWNRP